MSPLHPVALSSSPRRGSPCASWAALAGLGLVAGLALAVFLALPRVAAFSPLPAAQSVSARAPIRLTFNQPMDRASVEAALAIAPPVAGRLAWEGNTLTFAPAESWPLGSTVTVSLGGGRSLRGLPLVGDRTWSFSIGQLRLAYLAGDPANLWVIPATEAGGEAQQLTNEPFGVYDYGISPDGTQIAYAARSQQGGADLRLLNLDGSSVRDLLGCPDAACVSPAFSPDGWRLAYQRHSLEAGLSGEAVFGPSRVHVYTFDTRAEQPATSSASRFPRWSPDGRLAYLDTERAAVAVIDPATGGITYVPNASGEVGTWSPDGQYLVFPELVFPPEPTPDATGAVPEHTDTFYSDLIRVTVATNAVLNLSGEAGADDGSPVYSPDGAWLAFGRKSLELGQPVLGRQLWLMRPDGSDPRALTADPLYNHSAFRWSPDGAALAYMRFNAAEPGAPAEIWLITEPVSAQPGGPDPRRLAYGYLPEWLP